MPTVPPFQLVTLGHLALHDAEGRDLLPPDVAKPLALLSFLAAAPGRRCSRERLVDLFWGDSALEQGRSSLRQVLYRLRDVLGDEAISSQGSELQLTSALTTDRDAFLAALERDDLETALAQYGGPFVPDFVSRGTTEFEQWRDQEQDRLHDLFTNAIDAAGQRAIESGRASQAAALAQRVLQDHPLDERGWRLRLQAEQLSGSRIHLAASIAELRRLFATEGWEPQPRTLQLLDVLERTRADDSDQAAGESLDGDLIGRGPVMASLYHHWRHSARRIGAHLHLVGGAGLGKSRVMDDFAVRIRSERGRVVRAGAYPRQRFVPDSMLASVIAALADLPGAKGIAAESARILIDLQPTVSSRFPAAAPHANGDDHARAAAVGEAMRDLFEAVTDDGALCLLLDDAHWWDDDSRHQLEATIERLHNRPILVVTASRPGSSEIVTALTQERIELARWQEDDVLALLQSLGSTDDDSAMTRLAHALCDAAEGVPLLVIEALRLGLDRALIGLRERRWGFSRLDELVTVLHPGQLLRERASTLTPQQRHLLLVAWLLESEVTHADWPAVDTEAHGGTLVELERLGFLTSSGRGWKLGHDAIGETLEAAATDDAMRAAHRDAGLLSLQRGDHPIMLRQAAKHGVESRNTALLQQVATRWVRQCRHGGSVASSARLLQELLPEAISPATLQQLVRSLPTELRRRPWSARRLAPIWAVAGGIAVLAGSWLFARPEAPDAVIGILASINHRGPRELQLALRHDHWGDVGRGSADLVVPSASSRWASSPADSITSAPQVDPSGTRWLFSRVDSRDGGASDLVLASEGSERVVAPARGDDVFPSWSPDGRYAVFSTMRWAERDTGAFNLGIVEVATGAVRRLTASPDGDQFPKWSPSGTRIAFVRKPARAGPDSLCWRSVDGNRGICQLVPGSPLRTLAGWTAAHTVLVTTELGEACDWILVDIDAGTTQPQRQQADCGPSLAPDGTWASWVQYAKPTNGATSRLMVTSLTGSRATETFDVTRLGGAGWSPYWRGRWSRQPVDRIAVRHHGDTVYSAAPYQLRLAATDAAGKAVDISPAVIEWRSSDETLASVDSGGMVHPRGHGSLVIGASVGGWRSDSIRVTLAPAHVGVLFEEHWPDPAMPGWLPWGEPSSHVTTTPGHGSALLVNGDGEYTSGVYSRTHFPVKRGLALDLELSTPITRPKWQFLQVSLISPDLLTLSGPAGSGCTIKYPTSEGWANIHRMSGPTRLYVVDTSLASGRRFRFRLQLFPDGTCGVAIDGIPVTRGLGDAPARDSVAIVLGGQTVGSPLLIGPVKVWSGVPTDIDWSTLGPALAPPPGSRARRATTAGGAPRRNLEVPGRY